MPSAIGRLFPPFSQARRYWQAGMRNVKAFAHADYHYFAGLNHLIGRFYESILNGTPPPNTFVSTLRSRWVAASSRVITPASTSSWTRV